MKVTGLGEFKVQTLREVAPELWSHQGDCPEAIAEYHRTIIQADPRYSPEVETFYIVCLSTRRKIMGHTLIATGTIDTIYVSPAAVFRPAIVANAAVIVLMHNHPSGDPSPSEADIKVTRDLTKAGNLIKCEVLDHVIMGVSMADRPKAFVSLRELGYFYA